MNTQQANPNEKGIQRRNFLKLGGISLLALPLITRVKSAFGKSDGYNAAGYWQGPEGSQYCVHKTVYAGEVDSGYIWARIDKVWKRFTIRDVESKFWEWNNGERVQSFQEKIDGTSKPTAGGPHSPMVATYGFGKGRGDSSFRINNKVVGMEAVPVKDKIEEINNEMLDMVNSNADMMTKLQYLKSIHQQNIWRKDIEAGLEYFTTPDFETHTFLNLMENPLTTLCFQGCYNIFTSFEVRCIAQVVHPQDPNITKDFLNIAKYPYILHGFYHGFPPEGYTIPAVIYYHIEEFDNSMADKPGQRLVP